MTNHFKFFVLGLLLLLVALGGFYLARNPDMVRAAVDGVININGIIRGVTMPIDNTDVATKEYVATAAPALRLFYLTTTLTGGNGPLTACAAGYHMASYTELFLLAQKYNTALGRVSAPGDPGAPISVSGWARGRDTQNCTNWTSIESAAYGLTPTVIWSGVGDWALFSSSCNSGYPTWCMQNY